MAYAQGLRVNDAASYSLFYKLYADLLFKDYNALLPQFCYGRDDFYDFLLQNPQLVKDLSEDGLPIEIFPDYLRDYLYSTYGEVVYLPHINSWSNFFAGDNNDLDLPTPREKDPVYKYEEANPYKEPGLKQHFERIGRYSFVSRIQSYRYLRGSKSNVDKIEVLTPDCLGGIFTNKEKSIYYYIFLTEANYPKAKNACRILNASIYGK
ncbi:Uncharacterized [Syntrophomonas zehnderi OL-4]|uniref:Uncharacterized n=1 Tax=Syntrophomonas zehnderi OL-4 TaxID=690567 RepID=A0A0E4GBW4_9FIRM|nr:hypothetical protein [Syntrophomonas zehnderi]CFY01372.1 Uncharacterized [Syntrophomonas zehnderi OL-4]